MLIHGLNSYELPFLVDTTKIEGTYCVQDSQYNWKVMLILSSGIEFQIAMYSTIKINGVKITHHGDMDKCKKMAEIINTILELERQDPPVDMDKFALVGKAKPRKKKSK